MDNVTTQVLAAASGRPTTTTEKWLGALRLKPRGPRPAKVWSFEDAVLVLVTQALNDSGLEEEISISMALETRDEVRRIIDDDSARCWVICQPGAKGPLAWSLFNETQAYNALEALSLAGGSRALEAGYIRFFNLRELATDAAGRIRRECKRQQEQGKRTNTT
jgi:hypothetical protein